MAADRVKSSKYESWAFDRWRHMVKHVQEDGLCNLLCITIPNDAFREAPPIISPASLDHQMASMTTGFFVRDVIFMYL